MELTWILTILSFFGVLLARDVFKDRKIKKLKKDIWKKGIENEGDLTGYDLSKLIREANERRRKRLGDDNRDKKK